MPEHISAHISYREAIKSETAARKGLSNTPSPTILQSMKRVAEMCYEPARAHFGPLLITSFYRSPEVNKAIGGAKNSQHCLGEAIDIDSDQNAALFQWMRTNLPFDQIIWEYGDDTEPAWVHVSYHSEEQNRKHVLKAIKVNGRTVYRPWTP